MNKDKEKPVPCSTPNCPYDGERYARHNNEPFFGKCLNCIDDMVKGEQEMRDYEGHHQ